MFDRKLIFVSGKGGVGKSTISLLLAHQLASLGKRVLVVELGGRSHLGALLGSSQPFDFVPQKTEFGFSGARLSGPTCLSEYVNHFTRVETMTKIFLNNKFMKTLIPLAPGLGDLAILGHLTAGIRNHGPQLEYDHIVVDAPSTGAFLSMLKAPEFLSGIVDRGPLHKQSRGIFEVLNSAVHCHFVFVTLLESFPVLELMESTKAFRKAFATPFSVVVNKVLPELNFEGAKPEAFREFMEQKKQMEDVFGGQLQAEYQDLWKLLWMTTGLADDLRGSQKCSHLIKY